jgi:hypothetical protein
VIYSRVLPEKKTMGSSVQPKLGPQHAVRVADSSLHLGANIRITPQSRYYALNELSRRAGIPEDFFRSWKVSVSRERTVFEISNGVSKFISFPHASPQQMENLAAGRFNWVTVPLLTGSNPARNAGISDCVIPFVESGNTSKGPLFYLTAQNSLECSVDLPLAILLTLSRWEELLETPRDAHGRFRAIDSVAFKGKFLHRPIVDEYGVAFEQAMELLYPAWQKSERKLRIKISHDADHVGMPFRWKTAARHSIRSLAPLNSIRDVSSCFSRVEPSELKSVRDIATISKHHGLSSTVYWKAGPPTSNDSGYDPRHSKVRAVVRWLDQIGAESGVHPGYNTYRSPERLRREISILRDVLGDRPIGGRQHYLRWCPDTWIDWENCGLAYDSSVGYAEQIGFKAGTCIPYRPWLFPLNRQADLLEIPMLIMDRTLLGYMRLTKAQSIQEVAQIMNRCKEVGGVLTVLWHNDTFLEPGYRDLYLSLLQIVAGIENYNWQSDRPVLSK